MATSFSAWVRKAMRDILLDKQNFACAICGSRERRLGIDHCHKTGFVRGMLCNPCNSGLGFFQDEVALLARAIVYLQDFDGLSDDLKVRYDYYPRGYFENGSLRGPKSKKRVKENPIITFIREDIPPEADQDLGPERPRK